MKVNKELLGKIFGAFNTQLHIYQKIYRYYMGVIDTNASEYELYGDGLNDNVIMDADVIANYSYMNDRSKSKIGTNFIKFYVKTEVSYSVGQDLTFISHTGDKNIIDVIETSTAHWLEVRESNYANKC